MTIQSLRIEGRETEQPHDGTTNVQRAAIFVARSRNLRIIDCIFHDTADAIRLFQECHGTYIAGNEIFGNQISIERECIIMAGARESIVENNYIHDCPFATAIKMEGAVPAVDFSNIVRGNMCMRVGAGVTVKGGCIVTGNVLEATRHPAALVGHHCHFTDNRIIEGVRSGVQILSTDDTPENVIIANNSISNIHIACRITLFLFDGILGEIRVDFIPRNITISNNIIENDPTGTHRFSGIRFHIVGSNITIDNNQIYGADNDDGVLVWPGGTNDNTIERVRVTNNTITLKTNGNGVHLTAFSGAKHYLRHVVVSGNIVTKAEGTAAAATVGLRITGDPDKVILTSNDTSDTDTPFKIERVSGAGPTNLVVANNIGF